MTGTEIAVAIAVIAASAASATGAVISAQNSAAQAEFSASVQRRNAEAARAKAFVESERKRRDTKRILAINRARIGSAGLAIEGSPLDALTDFAAEGELDALLIEYAGELGSIGREEQAALFRARAGQAQTAGTITAASTLLSGASTAGRGLIGTQSPTEGAAVA